MQISDNKPLSSSQMFVSHPLDKNATYFKFVSIKPEAIGLTDLRVRMSRETCTEAEAPKHRLLQE